MEFDKKQLLDLIHKSSCSKTISISEIPDIDLYMDQVTGFMEDKLSDFKRTKDDKILTKTMINNYAKNNIIPSPVKKKYSKEHMILLILTYHMKQILSIGDIHSLLSPISEKVDLKNINGTEIEDLYENFLEIQSKSYDDFSSKIIEKIDEFKEQIHLKEDSEFSILYSIIFFLIIQSTMEKKLAENLIDTFFHEKN